MSSLVTHMNFLTEALAASIVCCDKCGFVVGIG